MLVNTNWFTYKNLDAVLRSSPPFGISSYKSNQFKTYQGCRSASAPSHDIDTKNLRSSRYCWTTPSFVCRFWSGRLGERASEYCPRSWVFAVSLVRSGGPSLVGNSGRRSIKFRDIDGERLVIRSCAILQDAERDLLTQ